MPDRQPLPNISSSQTTKQRLWLDGERTAVTRRIAYYRLQLSALDLLDSPHTGSEKHETWMAGYDTALRDLAEHPEIARSA